MTSPLYTAADQSLAHLLKTSSLARLLSQDREQLVAQSHFISYYHPRADRERAEQLLKATYGKTKADGLFLVRNCTASSQDFSLSLIYNERCYHYKIQLLYDIYFSIGKPTSHRALLACTCVAFSA